MRGMASKLASTRWSQIFAARTQDQTRRNLAIQNLTCAYWKPIYYYLKRRGHNHEEAQDLTQGFFCKLFIEGKLLQTADIKISRFRNLLYTALRCFVYNEVRNNNTQEKQPKGGMISLDVAAFENFDVPAAIETSEQTFYYAWISNLLDQILAQTRAYCLDNDMETHWHVFRQKVLAPIFEDADNTPLEEICQHYGIEDEAQASNMIVTVKRAFRRIFDRRLMDLTGSESEAKSELMDMFQFLSEDCAG